MFRALYPAKAKPTITVTATAMKNKIRSSVSFIDHLLFAVVTPNNKNLPLQQTALTWSRVLLAVCFRRRDNTGACRRNSLAYILDIVSSFIFDPENQLSPGASEIADALESHQNADRR